MAFLVSDETRGSKRGSGFPKNKDILLAASQDLCGEGDTNNFRRVFGVLLYGLRR